MANVATNVSAGKPKSTGGIWRAPAGTTLPTDATTALGNDFVCLGYVSEDGVTNTIERTTEKKKAWGGNPVMSTQTEFSDQFKFTLIEALNEEVQKAVFGDDNVIGTLAAGQTVKVNADEVEACVWVIETILTGNYIRRIVIPNGKGTSSGDISYTDSDAIGYEVTVECLPDATTQTHYEYTKAPSQSA